MNFFLLRRRAGVVKRDGFRTHWLSAYAGSNPAACIFLSAIFLKDRFGYLSMATVLAINRETQHQRIVDQVPSGALEVAVYEALFGDDHGIVELYRSGACFDWQPKKRFCTANGFTTKGQAAKVTIYEKDATLYFTLEPLCAPSDAVREELIKGLDYSQFRGKEDSFGH